MIRACGEERVRVLLVASRLRSNRFADSALTATLRINHTRSNAKAYANELQQHKCIAAARKSLRQRESTAAEGKHCSNSEGFQQRKWHPAAQRHWVGRSRA